MKLSCPKIVELDKTKPEVGDHAHNLPGGSLKFQSLNAVPVLAESASRGQNPDSGEARESTTNYPERQKESQDSRGGVQTLPNPWLFDSEALLRELDRIRETALQVPTNGDANATHFGLQLVINAAWTLRENIRYILGLHKERQRAFAQKHKSGTETQHQTIYALLNWVGITC